MVHIQKNLESVRIPKFNNAVRKGQSVAFMYAKFSNPLTEEDQQYLIVGCGMVTDKGDYHYFGPKDLIDKKKASKPKYRNFPSMNWAIRYSFQEPELLQIPFYPDPPSFRNKLPPLFRDPDPPLQNSSGHASFIKGLQGSTCRNVRLLPFRHTDPPGRRRFSPPL